MPFVPDLTFEANEPMVISETIDGETIIINLASGSYFSLKHSGAKIWEGVQKSLPLAGIAAALRSSYAVGDHDVEHEIAALIDRLTEEDLIRTKEGTTVALDVVEPTFEGARAPFTAPILDKFTDMEAMLLLDPVHDVDEAGWPHVPLTSDQMDG